MKSSIVDFVLSLQNLEFKEFKGKVGYRVCLSHLSSEYALSLTSERSKQQWVCSIINPKSYCPEGIELPYEIAFEILRSTLIRRNELSGSIKEWATGIVGRSPPTTSGCDVDLIKGENAKVVLTLRVHFTAKSQTTLRFLFEPVALDSFDTMQAKVDDLEMELSSIKSKVIRDRSLLIASTCVMCALIAVYFQFHWSHKTGTLD